MDKKDTLCVLAEAGIRVWPDGRVSPCCLNDAPARLKDGDQIYLYKDALGDAFQSEDFQSLRKACRDGVQDPRCNVCWSREAVGLSSKRQEENAKYPDLVAQIKEGKSFDQPYVADLSIGSTCNLKCRTCGPYNSSKWISEIVQVRGGSDHMDRQNKELNSIPQEESRKYLSSWYEYNEEFWTTFRKWAPNIRFWYFAGGEPLLIKRHFEFLKGSIDAGTSLSQGLSYVTNGTITPTQEHLDVWKRFRSVGFALSCDGLGKQFEYVRHGANWEDFQKNFQFFRSHGIPIIVNFTCSIFNVLSLPEHIQFFADRFTPISLTFVDFPDHFSLHAMPLQLKNEVAEHLRANPLNRDARIKEYVERAIEYMFLKDFSLVWHNTIHTIEAHDRFRKENFCKTFPEMGVLIDSLNLFGDKRPSFYP